MISVSGKNWEEINISKRLIDKLMINNGFSHILSKLILYNNFNEEEIFSIDNIVEFTNPFIKKNDFKIAVDIFYKSIIKKEKILIVGDYDVDGCVSTSLLVNFLKELKVDNYYYIPKRFTDGYGASIKVLEKLIKKKPKLIIFVDNGSNSSQEIKFLNEKGIKTIIIDHHEIYEPYPKSEALINPKKKCDYTNFNYFCSSSLTFFFLDLIIKNKKINLDFEKYLSLVLLSTVSDVMPMRKLNRLIAKRVFKNLDKYENDLFKKIFKSKKINRPINIEDFGFIIAPVINSAGRIDDPNKIIELLTSKNESRKEKIVQLIIKLNEKRKVLEEQSLKKINFSKIYKDKSPIIIINDNTINEGIIGIIAARLMNHFDKPCIVLTKSKNFLKASARSTSKFNIGFYIKKALDMNIILNGGGHNLAAGFSIKENKISKLKKFLTEQFSGISFNNKYLSKISLNTLNKKMLDNFKSIEPFGPSNNNPFFLIENIRIIKPTLIKNKYISCIIKSKQGKSISAISFNPLETDISKNLFYNKGSLNLIVQLKENFWNNKKNLQLVIIDLIVNPIST
jgi:single-stranded-DNA-specific exonuclease